MRIFITGANGMIGGETIRSAVVSGHRITAVGRGPLRLPPSYGKVDYYNIDLVDFERLKHIALCVSPDVIVHCGAMTNVDQCEREPSTAWKTNADPTRLLASVAQIIKARMIYVSTEGVFDGKDGFYKETDVPNPINIYGRTKLVGEWAVRDICENYVIARIGTTYSGRLGGKETFADRVVGNLKRGEPIQAFLDQTCSTTYAPVCGDRLVELCENNYLGVLNLSDRDVCSRVMFALAIANEFRLDKKLIQPVYLREIDLLAPRPMRLGLTTRIAEAVLKHQPLDTVEAMKRYRFEKESACAL